MSILNSDAKLISDILQSLMESSYCKFDAGSDKVLFYGSKSLLPFHAQIQSSASHSYYCISHGENLIPDVHICSALDDVPSIQFNTVVCLEENFSHDWLNWLEEVSARIADEARIIVSMPYRRFSELGFANKKLERSLISSTHRFDCHIIPYGFFHVNNPWLIDLFGNAQSWEKTLSWATCDQTFSSFLMFLETSFIRYLPKTVSNRVFMELTQTQTCSPTVFDHTPAIHSIDESLTPETLGHIIQRPLQQWCEELSNYLTYPRNFVLFYKMMKALSNKQDIDISHYLNIEILEKISKFIARDEIQERVEKILKSWHQQGNMKDILSYKDIPLGEIFDYDLTSDLLTGYGAYDEDKW